MGLNEYMLIGAALLPAMVLCLYIFKKDRVEKEPVWLLIRLLLFGVVCCFPAAYFEGIVIGAIDKLFSGSMYIMEDGSIALPTNLFYIYNALKYFIGVALIEEFVKWFTLKYFTKNNSEFDCLFDGIVYAVFVSLGFAAYENVLYVLDYGWMNAVTRGILSVPGHMFFAVMMGYYYSMWHITDSAGEMEREYKQRGLIDTKKPEFNSKKYVCLSLLIPTIAHGIYDYCCTVGTLTATLAFYAFVAFMYIYCFRKIKKLSDADAPARNYAAILMIKKYPELADTIKSELL